MYKLHEYNLSKNYTKEALHKYPNGAGLYFLLGVIEYKIGDKQDALKHLAIGYQLSQDPQIANAYAMIKRNKRIDLPI